MQVVFQFPRKASAKFLQFCANKLISVDSKNEISIYSLETKKTLVTYAPPSHATALLTDPSLDYAFIGLQNGAHKYTLILWLRKIHANGENR